jgi:hypothetical protein
VSWTDEHFEGFTQLHGVNPALSQHASMKEGIARPIGEFDEAKSFFGAEPLDDTLDGWTGRCLEPGLAKSRSGFERARLWVVGVNVEVATPRMTKILISQLWFLVD